MSRKCVVCNERPILTPEVYPGLCCYCDQDANLKRAYENIEWAARRARQCERRRWVKAMKEETKRYKSFDVASAFDDVVATVKGK